MIYVFPGQGSQTIGMGKSLFAEFSEFVHQANRILGYDLEELCVHDPQNRLNQTEYTQPALFVVNALSWLKKRLDVSIEPDYLAGHSLGEYNALFAASVFDFETGLKLVQKRGALMSQAQGGAMAAVIDLEAQQIEKILKEHQLNNLSIANYNSNTQIVISGPKQDIVDAQPIFKAAGASIYIPLKVSGAFHSSYMKESSQIFAEFLQPFGFNAPKCTVIGNVDAKPYQADKIRENLTLQMTHPVMWTQTIQYLLARGETDFEELGPGKVLSGLIKRIHIGR